MILPIKLKTEAKKRRTIIFLRLSLFFLGLLTINVIAPVPILVGVLLIISLDGIFLL